MKLKDVILLEAEQPEIKVKNGKLVGKYPEVWEGDFWCYQKQLTSLAGAPQSVDGDFSCSYNQLTSLEGAPQSVGGNLACHHCQLTSLQGAPKIVVGDFVCSNNQLTSLEGAPQSVGGSFWCISNPLTSLQDIHEIITHIGETADFEKNPIKSHVLGLLLIDGLKAVRLDNSEVQDILNTHLAGARNVFACQAELIEAGFEEYAQL